jgi:hypothetical protein
MDDSKHIIVTSNLEMFLESLKFHLTFLCIVYLVIIIVGVDVDAHNFSIQDIPTGKVLYKPRVNKAYTLFTQP